VAELINRSKPVEKLIQVGLAKLILTGGWFIWWERRKFVHGETIQHPTHSALSIATLTTNYKRAMKKSPIRKEVWKKPLEGKLLINVDVSFRPENGSGSTDAVIRNSSGSFIAASHSYFEHVVDAPSAELMAVKDGLLLARHIGCNRIIIQSDCLEMVETMQQGVLWRQLGHLYTSNVIIFGRSSGPSLLNIVTGNQTRWRMY
jgi:hypothetical protein